MKVVVAVKQVKVLGDEVELLADGSGVDPDLLDRGLNEWDSHAQGRVELRELSELVLEAVLVRTPKVDKPRLSTGNGGLE